MQYITYTGDPCHTYMYDFNTEKYTPEGLEEIARAWTNEDNDGTEYYITGDPEKMEKIAERETGKPGDLYYMYEEIYRTEEGRYIWHGIGGAGTICAERLPDGWTAGGAKRAPITPEQFKQWQEGGAIF